MIGEGLRPVALGLAIGLAGAGRLYDVRPSEPTTLGVVLLLVTTVALLACYVPARRATRIDPGSALRFE